MWIVTAKRLGMICGTSSSLVFGRSQSGMTNCLHYRGRFLSSNTDSFRVLFTRVVSLRCGCFEAFASIEGASLFDLWVTLRLLSAPPSTTNLVRTEAVSWTVTTQPPGTRWILSISELHLWISLFRQTGSVVVVVLIVRLPKYSFLVSSVSHVLSNLFEGPHNHTISCISVRNFSL